MVVVVVVILCCMARLKIIVRDRVQGLYVI